MDDVIIVVVSQDLLHKKKHNAPLRGTREAFRICHATFAVVWRKASGR